MRNEFALRGGESLSRQTSVPTSTPKHQEHHADQPTRISGAVNGSRSRRSGRAIRVLGRLRSCTWRSPLRGCRNPARRSRFSRKLTSTAAVRTTPAKPAPRQRSWEQKSNSATVQTNLDRHRQTEYHDIGRRDCSGDLGRRSELNSISRANICFAIYRMMTRCYASLRVT